MFSWCWICMLEICRISPAIGPPGPRKMPSDDCLDATGSWRTHRAHWPWHRGAGEMWWGFVDGQETSWWTMVNQETVLSLLEKDCCRRLSSFRSQGSFRSHHSCSIFGFFCLLTNPCATTVLAVESQVKSAREELLQRIAAAQKVRYAEVICGKDQKLLGWQAKADAANPSRSVVWKWICMEGNKDGKMKSEKHTWSSSRPYIHVYSRWCGFTTALPQSWNDFFWNKISWWNHGCQREIIELHDQIIPKLILDEEQYFPHTFARQLSDEFQALMEDVGKWVEKCSHFFPGVDRGVVLQNASL